MLNGHVWTPGIRKVQLPTAAVYLALSVLTLDATSKSRRAHSVTILLMVALATRDWTALCR